MQHFSELFRLWKTGCSSDWAESCWNGQGRGQAPSVKKCSFSLSPLPCCAGKVSLANTKRFSFPVYHCCSAGRAVLISSRVSGLRSWVSKNPTDLCIQPLTSLPSINHLSVLPGFQLCEPLCRRHLPSQNPAGFILPKALWGTNSRENAQELGCKVFAWHLPTPGSSHCYLPFNFTSTGFYC